MLSLLLLQKKKLYIFQKYMIKRVYRDLYIDIEKAILFRQGMVESKHLMHQFGSTPCINKHRLEKYLHLIKWIGFKTDKRKFVISKKMFLDNCKSYMNGTEEQLYCHNYFYTITELDKLDI